MDVRQVFYGATERRTKIIIMEEIKVARITHNGVEFDLVDLNMNDCESGDKLLFAATIPSDIYLSNENVRYFTQFLERVVTCRKNTGRTIHTNEDQFLNDIGYP